MPKYVYSCDICHAEFEVYHGMKDKMDCCAHCEKKGCVHRIPQLTNIVRRDNTGSQVKEAIEDNKKILEQMKKDAIRSYDE